jgi:hypothetical protein
VFSYLTSIPNLSIHCPFSYLQERLELLVTMFAYHPERPDQESGELEQLTEPPQIAAVEPSGSRGAEPSATLNGVSGDGSGEPGIDVIAGAPRTEMSSTVNETVVEDREEKTQKPKKEIKILTDDEIKEQRQKMLYKINSYCIPCIKNKFASVAESQELDIEQFAKDMEFREALLFIRNSYSNALRHQQIDLRNALRNDIAQVLVDAEIVPVYKKILELFMKLDFIDGEGKLIKKYFNPVGHVMMTLFNYTDKCESFTKAICNAPGLLELIICFLREKKESHFSKEIDKV